MSKITDFYAGGLDDSGRTLYDLLDRGDAFWEHDHHFIQWLFPLPERSVAVPTSPIATADDYVKLSEPRPAMRMIAALGRFLNFLEHTTAWRSPRDHNHLRITRVLRCLTLCGHSHLARTFYRYLREVAPLSHQDTLTYWENALHVSNGEEK